MDSSRRYRSLFWPVVLIGIGVIWLLGALGLLPVNSLATLARLWPLILIAIGLDLLVGRRSPAIGGLIGLLVVGIAAAVLLAAPALRLPQSPGVRLDRYTEPVGQAASATVSLHLGSSPTTLSALRDSGNLVDAEIRHVGAIHFRASGDREKTISLDETNEGVNFMFGVFENLYWKVGLSPAVPLTLNLNSGSGSVDGDLKSLKLVKLSLDTGSGSMNLTLPESVQAYTVDAATGSGSIDLALPASTPLALRLDTGSGSVNVRLAPGTEARIEVQHSGSGSVNLPSGWTQVSRGQGDEGVWETQGYAQSTHRVLIQIADLGSGSITVR
ncbi:MAG TPA: DUF4097 family beta strand repeat-containing protein [Anaerolineaceae bacterium]|nr:DUF4097 family beta strand repeat-containing protein [Anaerolineaceae bacterium]